MRFNAAVATTIPPTTRNAAPSMRRTSHPYVPSGAARSLPFLNHSPFTVSVYGWQNASIATVARGCAVVTASAGLINHPPTNPALSPEKNMATVRQWTIYREVHYFVAENSASKVD